MIFVLNDKISQFNGVEPLNTHTVPIYGKNYIVVLCFNIQLII